MKIASTDFIWSDIHAGISLRLGDGAGHDEAALSCALAAYPLIMQYNVPHKDVIIGDLMEAASVSHWEFKRRKRPPWTDFGHVIELPYLEWWVKVEIQSGESGWALLSHENVNVYAYLFQR